MVAPPMYKCSFFEKWKRHFNETIIGKDGNLVFKCLVWGCSFRLPWIYDIEKIVWDKFNDENRFRVEWKDDSISFIDFERLSELSGKTFDMQAIDIFWRELEAKA
jgi:hypothetical protein